MALDARPSTLRAGPGHRRSDFVATDVETVKLDEAEYLRLRRREPDEARELVEGIVSCPCSLKAALAGLAVGAAVASQRRSELT